MLNQAFSAVCTYTGGNSFNCGGTTCSKIGEVHGWCWLIGFDVIPSMPCTGSCTFEGRALHATSFVSRAPECPWEWCCNAESPRVSVNCEVGWVDCGGVMGCETPCHSCNPDNPNDPNKIRCSDSDTQERVYSCTLAGAHCYSCTWSQRRCSLISDGYCPSACYFNNDVDCTTCPAYTDSNGVTRTSIPFTQATGVRVCARPKCWDDTYCTSGKNCYNPGEVNSFCARSLDAGTSFLASATQELNGVLYDFIIYERSGENIALLDILPFEVTAPVVPRLRSGSYFNLGGENYRVFFTVPPHDFSLKVFTINYYTRLTYNIFPVCGNSVCETCESESNCLHYPPESCMSCPVDCPYITDSELDNYNALYLTGWDYGDLFNNVDNVCKVKTLDSNSICNPLCITHTFIDTNGCMFKRYVNALPETTTPVSGPDEVAGITDSDTVFNDERTDSYTIEFKGQSFTVYDRVSQMGSITYSGFLGESNANCISNCECASSNCAKGKASDAYGRCCPTGFVWSDKDNNVDFFCDSNGRVKASLRDAFLQDLNSDGFIDATQGVDVHGALDNSGAKSVADFICTGNPGLDKISCSDGIDPLCAYTQSNNLFEKAELSGVWQCRRERTLTENILPELRCTLHSHGFGSYTTTFLLQTTTHVMAITDSPNECAKARCQQDSYTTPDILLKSITYQEYCTTQQYACKTSTFVTNTQPGGFLYFTGQVQDASRFYFSSNLPYLMSVGFYCSLFGNDIERIMNINGGVSWSGTGASTTGGEKTFDAGGLLSSNPGVYGQEYDMFKKIGSEYYVKFMHLPQIDRDSQERMYHYLWNYESCVQAFGLCEDNNNQQPCVPSCDNINRNDKLNIPTMYKTDEPSGWEKISNEHFVRLDENDWPTSPRIGTYSQNEILFQARTYSQEIGWRPASLWVNRGLSFAWLYRTAAIQFQKTTQTINGVNYDTDGPRVHKSRAFCEKFWEAYEETYGTFDWRFNSLFSAAGTNIISENPDLGTNDLITLSFDSDGDGVQETYTIVSNCNYNLVTDISGDASGAGSAGKSRCPAIIINSCLWWYEPFLDTYYTNPGYQTDDGYYFGIEPVWNTYFYGDLVTEKYHTKIDNSHTPILKSTREYEGCDPGTNLAKLTYLCS